MSKKLGIIGVGMVGGAVYAYYPDAIPYSPRKYPQNKENINEADIIFVCVPTPFMKDGTGFDLSYVHDTISILHGGKTVVIKSTVIPGTTVKLQEKYPQHKFLFNPEFLREAHAVDDFKNTDRQIVGTTSQSEGVAQALMDLLPPAPFSKIIPSTEAEMVKYFGNTFLATRVIFANQMFDVCKTLGLDYNRVKEAAGADPRIGPSHFNVDQDGYRGYGKKCLPKDTRALIQLADSVGVDMQLLKALEEINHGLTGGVDKEADPYGQ
jgi:UDPglucose 6-dehydrogenase